MIHVFCPARCLERPDVSLSCEFCSYLFRTDWGAAAFARLKSIIVTGMKNHVRFIQYRVDPTVLSSWAI
jgi:hypothetical protein